MSKNQEESALEKRLTKAEEDLEAIRSLLDSEVQSLPEETIKCFGLDGVFGDTASYLEVVLSAKNQKLRVEVGKAYFATTRCNFASDSPLMRVMVLAMSHATVTVAIQRPLVSVAGHLLSYTNSEIETFTTKSLVFIEETK